MIKGIAHVCFVVRDLEAALAFYRDKLGLEPAFDFLDEKGERFGLYLHAGKGGFLELIQGEVTELAAGQSYRHLCLQVEDIQAAAGRLRERGVQVTDPILGGEGSWQAWVKDLEGNSIELHAYTPESKQLTWQRAAS